MTQALTVLALSLLALTLGHDTLKHDAESLAGTYGFKVGGYGVVFAVLLAFTKP